MEDSISTKVLTQIPESTRKSTFGSRVFLLRVLCDLCGENFLLLIPFKPDPTKSLTFRPHGNTVPFVKPCGEMTERPKVLAC
jgi:hypothetical protein